jgi:PAS domain S-box-containing protein
MGKMQEEIKHTVGPRPETPLYVWVMIAAISVVTIGSEMLWHFPSVPDYGPVSVWHHALTVVVALLLYAMLYSTFRYRNRSRAGQNASFSAEHFRTLAQAAGDVAFTYDVRKREMLWTSDLGKELLGYEPGELQVSPEHFGKLVHQADQDLVRNKWTDLINRRPASFEARILHQDGKWNWVQVHAVPTGGNGHAAKVVGVFRQAQKLHEAEDALVEAQRLQTVGTMAGGIAHEFNNHLTPIRGYLELALDDLGPDHISSEGLRTALDRVEYCAELVSQIQAFGRKSVLMPKPENVARLLPTMVRLAMSRDLQKAEGITLNEVIPEDLPEIWVDRARLQDAVIQLVANGMEAMPDGGTFTIRAEEVYVHKRHSGEGGSRSGTFLCLTFSDTGEGIAPEHQAQIFDPFFTTRGRARARGMGLSMVQGMVAQHDGYIEVQSHVGQGTQVRLFLPLGVEKTLRGDAVLALEHEEDTVCAVPAATVGTVLVADDEESIRGIVRRVFAKEGWRILEAADGEEVNQKLSDETTRPDLVMLDLVMPGPSAEETVRLIRERGCGTKVLLISGFTLDERIERLTRNGDVGYISKPFSPKELLCKVDEVMTRTAA